MRKAAMQSVSFNAHIVRATDIAQSAAGQQAAAPGPQPAQAFRLVKRRSGIAVGRFPGQRDSFEGRVGNIHAPVNVHREIQAVAVDELGNPGAAASAVVQHRLPDMRQLLNAADSFQQKITSFTGEVKVHGSLLSFLLLCSKV